MRMCAPTIGCVVMGVTLTLLGSPVAQADDASFVRDAEALGFVQGPDNLIRPDSTGGCNTLTLEGVRWFVDSKEPIALFVVR